MKYPLEELNRKIVACRRCPRLTAFREEVAETKRKRFKDWDYWGKPVPGFGDTRARLLLVGLAPAAHGGNRTGRVFTGDKSADFLVRCLYDVSLASQPNSDHLDDGLKLYGTYMTPILKCVPPGDRPKSEELRNCSPFFEAELLMLDHVRCILALGKIAFDGCLRFWRSILALKVKDYPFVHGQSYDLGNGITLVASYHPSPRNVHTGRLTYEQMVAVLERTKRIAGLGYGK